ncbi:MAG TPA: type II restriction endonuclease [Porphyromonadaceae bacterium]|nr:type II restriction endonuclease [Porphyromonadaceae bacterium]
MKITEVKTAFKIADVKIKEKDILEFKYLDSIYNEKGELLPNNILKLNVPRVYIIVSNGIIKKIGGSEDKNGMKGTLHIYQDGGINGQPSQRSIGVWWLLFHELINNNKVEVYMIYQDLFDEKVKGLFGETIKKVSISYKYIEGQCLADYYSVEGHNPEWNYQENHEVWPEEVTDLEIITKKLKGKKKNNFSFRKALIKMGHKGTKILR